MIILIAYVRMSLKVENYFRVFFSYDLVTDLLDDTGKNGLRFARVANPS